MVTYDLTEISNYTNVCYNQLTQEEYDKIKSSKQLELMPCPIVQCDNGYIKMKRKTNTLIFLLSTSLGIDDITPKNYVSVYNRLNYIEKLNGAYHSSKDFDGNVEPEYYTLEDIQKHIGLKTNGIRLTKTQFLSKISKRFQL
jgi:hypothetical protein